MPQILQHMYLAYSKQWITSKLSGLRAKLFVTHNIVTFFVIHNVVHNVIHNTQFITSLSDHEQ